MKTEIHFSDEFLNAYLDEELSHSDKARLLTAVREDEQLSRRLCQLQRVRNMVQLAYHEVSPQFEHQATAGKKKTLPPVFATAASVLLLLGVLAGWFMHNHFNQQQPGLTEIVQELRTNSPQTSTPWKLMVQVSTNDSHRFNILMDETERLLKNANDNNERVIIQILANASGIHLLKDDHSPMAIRIHQLKMKYNNLLLTACGQTLRKLQLKEGQTPKLLSEARVVPSALQEVIEKQKLGWTYIKI